jgi:hypothetical protein
MKNRKEIRRYCQLIVEINSTHWSIDNSDHRAEIEKLEEKLTLLEDELVIILKTIVKD